MLSADEATHIDVLLEESGLSFGDLNAAILGLDMRELIRVLPGKNYARKVKFQRKINGIESIRINHAAKKLIKSGGATT